MITPDTIDHIILRCPASMKVFAEGEPTFIWGEWEAWVAACRREGHVLPPSDFKKPRAQELS